MFDLKEIIRVSREKGTERFEFEAEYTNSNEGKKND